MKTIRLDNVSKVYQRHFALHRVTTEFNAGQLTLVLGGNGAGKTTLMNLLATLEPPSDGSIRFGDWDFETFSRRGRRNIGWVSHDSLLYPELSGRENLEFYAKMYGIKYPSKTAQEWLDRIELSAAADKRVRTYSRGMKQRLSIARALIHRPALVLLDEPMTGLDHRSKDVMLRIFDEARSQGQIVVMITHDFSVPISMADRVIILDQGKLVFHDSTHEGMNLADLYLEKTS